MSGNNDNVVIEEDPVEAEDQQEQQQQNESEAAAAPAQTTTKSGSTTVAKTATRSSANPAFDDDSEEKIRSAVQFLSNPNVKKTPYSRRVAFLEHKGLTSDEIAEAFARVNKAERATKKAPLRSQVQPVSRPNALVQQQHHAPPPPPPPQTALVPQRRYTPINNGWKDIFIAVVIASGLGAGIVYIFKKYVLPYIGKLYSAQNQQKLKDKKEKEQRLKKTEEQTALIQNTVNQMKNDIDAIKMVFDAQANNNQQVLNTIQTLLSKKTQETEAFLLQSITSLKQEVNSTIQELPQRLGIERALDQINKNQSTLVTLKAENAKLKSQLRALTSTSSTSGVGLGSSVFGQRSNNTSPVSSTTADAASENAGDQPQQQRTNRLSGSPPSSSSSSVGIKRPQTLPAWQMASIASLQQQQQQRASGYASGSSPSNNNIINTSTSGSNSILNTSSGSPPLDDEDDFVEDVSAPVSNVEPSSLSASDEANDNQQQPQQQPDSDQ